jgi:hypothetical protein
MVGVGVPRGRLLDADFDVVQTVGRTPNRGTASEPFIWKPQRVNCRGLAARSSEDASSRDMEATRTSRPDRGATHLEVPSRVKDLRVQSMLKEKPS